MRGPRPGSQHLWRARAWPVDGGGSADDRERQVRLTVQRALPDLLPGATSPAVVAARCGGVSRMRGAGMGEPELMTKQALQESADGPAHRWFNRPESGRWQQPVLSEWELRAARWTDRHEYNELNYVLEGELHVESGGVTVVAVTG